VRASCPASWDAPPTGEEFVAVLPGSDPLARAKRPVALEQLAERDWVLFGPDHGLSELILDICSGAGFAPRRTVQTDQVAAACHLAAAGLGVTIIPDNIVPTRLGAAIRHLKRRLARQLVAFTRQDCRLRDRRRVSTGPRGTSRLPGAYASRVLASDLGQPPGVHDRGDATIYRHCLSRGTAMCLLHYGPIRIRVDGGQPNPQPLGSTLWATMCTSSSQALVGISLKLSRFQHQTRSEFSCLLLDTEISLRRFGLLLCHGLVLACWLAR
jgi:LysR substrate binding domain